MRTNVDLDDRLLARAMKKAGVRTKREAIHVALREYLKAPPDYSAILALKGRGIMAKDYDPKAGAPDKWEYL